MFVNRASGKSLSRLRNVGCDWSWDKPVTVAMARDSFMTNVLQYDLCVLGGGGAGLVAARTAARFGAKVVIVEKRALGGAYLTQTIPVQAFCAAALQTRRGRNRRKNRFCPCPHPGARGRQGFCPRLCAGTAWRLRHRVDPRRSAVSVGRRGRSRRPIDRGEAFHLRHRRDAGARFMARAGTDTAAGTRRSADASTGRRKT